MRVLIADKFETSGVEGLKALGCDVIYDPELKDQALADAISAKGADVLVVRSTKVNDAAMNAPLKLIVRAGAGVNTIDVKAATGKKIVVANCPGKNAMAVAELALGLMLALDRRIADNVADLRAGKWNKKEYSKARGLYGQTLGVLGAGSIAVEVIKRASAFGMPVVMWSRRYNGENRSLSAAEAQAMGLDGKADVTLAPTPADVAARADVLSVHLALGPETKGLINNDILSKLKSGAMFINTARAEVVDAEALRAAIKDRKLRVGLDVFANEPATPSGEFADPIASDPGVIGTHHIGASTDQAQEAIAAETVRIVKSFKDTGKAPNAVN